MVTTSAVKSRAKLQIAINKDKLNLKIKNTGDYDKYKKLQDKAIAGKIGLWKEVKKEQLPRWLQREHPGILKN